MHSEKFNLDKLYTKLNVAHSCVAQLDLSKFDLIIEPSVGAGAFVKAIPSSYEGAVLCYDIEPEFDGAITQNWFDFDPESIKDYKKVLVLGNPPFGVRNKLSLDFILKACTLLNLHTIAFILPNVYNKHTLQSKIPKDLKLVSVTPLNANSFEYKGDPYKIPTSFYIFSKEGEVDLRFDPALYTETDDFVYASATDYDFFVMGAAPHVVKDKPSNTNRGYYIKVKPEKQIKNIIETFQKINWKEFGNSSASGGVAWFSKPELIKAYIEGKSRL